MSASIYDPGEGIPTIDLMGTTVTSTDRRARSRLPGRRVTVPYA
jgi:hypothetical protein